ncbi:hypothetical protein F6455_14095 [Proteobacteria bacterium 005FR1]|nr:hypothetical protein [Proteobacteria bacterium 005FR1]
MSIRLPILIFAIFFLSMTSHAEEQSRSKLEQEVMQVLDDFMSTFNRMDIPAWEATFHFPHYRLASGNMNVLEGPGTRSAEAVRKAIGPEWHHSAWDRREILHLSKDKVHVNTRFSRYRADGTAIASYDSLYILTRENDRWGIKLRSSMAP